MRPLNRSELTDLTKTEDPAEQAAVLASWGHPWTYRLPDGLTVLTPVNEFAPTYWPPPPCPVSRPLHWQSILVGRLVEGENGAAYLRAEHDDLQDLHLRIHGTAWQVVRAVMQKLSTAA